MHESIEQLSNVWLRKCLSLITKIMNNHGHSMHKYITVLLHGHLQTVKCRTYRLHKTFSPAAIKLYCSNRIHYVDVAVCVSFQRPDSIGHYELCVIS